MGLAPWSVTEKNKNSNKGNNKMTLHILQEKAMEIAQTLGEPINTQLPVPVELQAMADVSIVDPGEKLFKFSTLDNTADVILDVDANGYITTVKRTPLGDTAVSFKGLNSKLEYLEVDEVMNSLDLTTIGRRKESITRGMDKTEVKLIFDAILSATGSYHPGETCQEFTVGSADDLYDVVIGMKQYIEDYGDKFLLMCGTAFKNGIDTYDKDNVTSFNYNIELIDRFAKAGIEVMKIFGQVSNVSGETESALMNTNKAILLARNSRIAQGKPVKFARRRISPSIAEWMGADVDTAQRGMVVGHTPVIVESTGAKNVLAYSIYGYESIAMAITNPKAIAYADASVIL